MVGKLKVLVASRSKSALEQLRAQLASDHRFELHSRHIENGHADPLYGLSFVPDVVVMALNERGHHDLSELTKDQHALRPPLIVLAEHGDAQTMRLAMQAGARDFLPGVLSAEELVASVERTAAQRPKPAQGEESKSIVIVNAKGGSGATFIASNLAYVLRTVSNHSTALLSLDMQFESLGQYFDVALKHGLMDVLEAVDELDSVALDAYMTQHVSGLRLIAAQPEMSFETRGGRAAELGVLFDKMAAQYERVVIDMPRRVDEYTRPVLDRASRVVLVAQQTVSHLRDAMRMLQIFNHHGLHNEQMLIVINRFEKGSAISIDDVQRAARGIEVVTLPSDFKTVAESINLGVPIYEHARGSAVTKGLVNLCTTLGGRQAQPSGGLFGKAFSSFLRKDNGRQPA
jgi:pilus assembly protein CpaE